MKSIIQLIPIIILILAGTACNSMMTVESSGNICTITLELTEQGTLNYHVKCKGTEVVRQSIMGMDIADPTLDFNSNLTFVSSEARLIDETYSLPTGKTSTYLNLANETAFRFTNPSGKMLTVVCRAYDDGVAFRYVVEDQDSITIIRERTSFSIPENTVSWMMDYIPYYENFYPERMLDTVTVKSLSYPALMKIKNGTWLLLTEACVYDQPGTQLKKTGRGNELIVELPEEKYTVGTRWESPWRTFIIGGNPGAIVESVMVENLNPPSEIKDMSWIHPGVAVFPWWGNFLANSYPDTLKRYVDLAAEMKWEWLEFDVSLVGSPFRTSKLWETTNWLPELTAYARSKGIRVYGWDEIGVLETPGGRDHVYGKYRDLGIDGIKIDYLNSDHQYAMKFRRDAIADAAKHHLMVSFHGETVPRGQRRTWPNVMTLEGVRGAEYYALKGYAPPTPEHNCILPFTRNVVGPMDYTPVTFTVRPENPRKTTYAHELALGVIVESGWLVMADRPEAYLNSPAKEMLQNFEAAWDETRFIDGYPGDFICLARRKAGKWFIAGINASKERSLEIPLKFIGPGTHVIEIFEDQPGEEMTSISRRRENITSVSVLKINMIANGGFCSLVKGN